MKLIIFGATGTVGRLLAEQALANGDDVTVFARKPPALKPTHATWARQIGDVLDSQAVADAVRRHDAVLVALGSRSPGNGPFRRH